MWLSSEVLTVVPDYLYSMQWEETVYLMAVKSFPDTLFVYQIVLIL